MREKTVENAIKDYLTKIGVYFVKRHANGFTKSGIPDILACWNGRFVGIEVKKPVGGIVSKLQQYNLDAIERAGGISIVARKLTDVSEVIK